MLGLNGMRRGMAVRRIVTAAHVPALQADAQMQPLTARSQTVLAAVDRLWQASQVDMVEMRALSHRMQSLATSAGPSAEKAVVNGDNYGVSST